MDEFELIARYFAPLQGEGDDLVVGQGDDGAVIAAGSSRLVVVVDTLVAGVHFPLSSPPHAIGYRAGAVNLSDLAAMGSSPRWATLALTLPEADPHWLAEFSSGLAAALQPAATRLIGGDTTRGSLTVTVQLIGLLDGEPLTRAGAQPGDLICVSGTLGDACAGLAVHAEPPAVGSEQMSRDWLVQRFYYPQPRLALGQVLRDLAHAAIDISDGLLADLGHIARSSACAAEIDLDAVPLSAAHLAVCGREQALRNALTGGDDYELVFTLPPSALAALRQQAVELCVDITVIGRIETGSGLHSRAASGAATAVLAASGYRHFS